MALWCKGNNLDLNSTNTREMIIEFRKNKSPMNPLWIDGQRTETVDNFKLLGNTISNDLSWKVNTNAIVSKAHQRLYFLRQLRKFGLKKETAYRCTIESALSFFTCVWFGGLSAHQQRHLDRVVKTAGRIIGCSLPPLGTTYRDRCPAHTMKIMSDPQHPAHHPFVKLPSGRRYRSIKTKSARFSQTM